MNYCAKRMMRRNPLSARRRFCDKATIENDNARVENKSEAAYKQLENLDFATATKMLFSEQPEKKQFGFDWHLVQFFFACMPSLAVYLLAQYARSEMRKMDAVREERIKIEEEEKAKEMEKKALEDRERYVPEISEVKTRLDRLEETMKNFAAQSNKMPNEDGDGKNAESKKTTPLSHSPDDKLEESTKNSALQSIENSKEDGVGKFFPTQTPSPLSPTVKKK